MKNRVRSVSVTLGEEAARYVLAMKRALARKPFLKSDGRHPSRDEVHDRSRPRAR